MNFHVQIGRQIEDEVAKCNFIFNADTRVVLNFKIGQQKSIEYPKMLYSIFGWFPLISIPRLPYNCSETSISALKSVTGRILVSDRLTKSSMQLYTTTQLTCGGNSTVRLLLGKIKKASQCPSLRFRDTLQLKEPITQSSNSNQL